MNNYHLRGGAAVAALLLSAISFSGPFSSAKPRASKAIVHAGPVMPISTSRVGGQAPIAGLTPNSQLMSKQGPSLAAARHRSLSGSFMKNDGQWSKDALFMAHSKGLDYWITKNGLVLDYSKLLSTKRGLMRQGDVVKMSLVGGKVRGVEAEQPQSVKTDFMLAHMKHPVRTSSYGEVTADNLYPGISMRSYFDSQRPRYDLIVRPGADPSQIRFNVSGAQGVSVDKSGALTLSTSIGQISEQGLKAYTVADGKRTPVSAAFKVISNREVGFTLGQYDKSKKLVIDPLIFGSYFGGDDLGQDGRDSVDSVVSEPNGDIFMTGWTEAVNFPIIAGAYQINLSGLRNAFVTLFRGDGYSVLYNSFFGGSGSDEGHFVQLSPDGTQLWIAGITTSPDLPVTNGCLQPTPSSSVAVNAFLLNFTLDANNMPIDSSIYATYFGPDSGSVFTLAGFVIAPNGNLLLAGLTNGLVTTAVSADSQGLGGNDVYLAVIDPTGLTPLKSRLFGGEWNDCISGLTTDSQGDFVISGTVLSPTQNGSGSNNQNYDLSQDPLYFETGNVGWPNAQLLRGDDIYVAKISSDPSLDLATIWSGVVGGSADDFAPEEGIDNPSIYGVQNELGAGSPAPIPCNVACDINDNVYMLGYSISFDYPRVGSVIGNGNLQGVVVTKIKNDGSSFVYSTSLNTSYNYSQGVGDTVVNVIPVGIGVDGSGYATITGMIRGFPDFFYTGTPPNPLTPSSVGDFGSIQTTSDGLKTASTNLGGTDMPTTDGWVNVISPNADQLVYGSYIGGAGNDVIEPPYVDSFGDIWLFGWTDLFFGYEVQPVIPQTGTPPKPLEIYADTPLPSGFITPLAFKSFPDEPLPVPTYGLAGFVPGLLNYAPSNSGLYPTTVYYSEYTDGYILRFRLFAPTISSIVLSPAIVPGGTPDGNAADGGIATGRVTLSAPAPTEGVQVTLTLDNPSVAFFNGSTSPTQQTIIFASGQTTQTFTVASNPVLTSQICNVSANYSGNAATTPLTVIPWLSQFVVTPAAVSGGSNLQAQIGLSSAAPAAGVTVPITITLNTPNGPVVSTQNALVPGGSTTATVTIPTPVTTVQETMNLSASLLGVTITTQSPVILNPLNISVNTFTLSSSSLSAGGTITGTVTLSTPAPDAGVPIVFTSSRPNAVFFENTPGVPSATGTVTVVPGGTTGTVTLYGGTVPNTRTVSFTASIAGGAPIAASNTVTIGRPNSTFTLSPNSVPGGGTSTGTITIVDANNNALTATAQLDTPTNNAQDLLTFALTNNDTTGAIKSLTTTSATDGTTTLTAAPWNLPVVIDPGTSSNTFTVTSSTVQIPTLVQFTSTFGSIGDPTAPQVINQGLTVNAVGVKRVYFNRPSIRSNKMVAFFVELNAPVPASATNGLSVTIATPSDPSNPANSLFFDGPSKFTITIPAGQTSVGALVNGVFVESPAHTFIARKFSRPVNATATAETGATPGPNGTTNYASTATASILILR